MNSLAARLLLQFACAHSPGLQITCRSSTTSVCIDELGITHEDQLCMHTTQAEAGQNVRIERQSKHIVHSARTINNTFLCYDQSSGRYHPIANKNESMPPKRASDQSRSDETPTKYGFGNRDGTAFRHNSKTFAAKPHGYFCVSPGRETS